MSHLPTMMGSSRMRGRSVPPSSDLLAPHPPQQQLQQRPPHQHSVELPLSRRQQPPQLTRSMSHMPLQQRPPSPQRSTSPSMGDYYDPNYYDPQSAHQSMAYAPAPQPTYHPMSHQEPSRQTHYTRASVPHQPYPPPHQSAPTTAAVNHTAAAEEDVSMEDVECKLTASISSIQQQRALTSFTTTPVVDPLNADGLLTPLNLADDVTPEEERLLLELQAKLRAIREENQQKAAQKKKEDQLLEDAKFRVVAIEHRSAIVDAIRLVYESALEQHEWNEKRLAPTTPEELQRLSEQRQPEYLLKTKQEQVEKLKKIINSIEAPSRDPQTVEGVITQPLVAHQFLRTEVKKRIEQEEQKISKLEKQIENKLKQRELNTTQEPPIKARLRHKLELLNGPYRTKELVQREQLKQKQDELAYLRRIAQGWKAATGPNPPATLPQELVESKWWQEKVKLEEEAKEAPSKADQEKRTSDLTGELLEVQAEIAQLQLTPVGGPVAAPKQPPTESATSTTPATTTSTTTAPTESSAPKPAKKRKKKHHDKKKNKQARQEDEQLTESAEQPQQQPQPNQQPQLQPMMTAPQMNYPNQGQGQIQGGMGWNGGGQQVLQQQPQPQPPQQQMMGPQYMMVQPYPVMPVQYFQPSMQQPMAFQPQPLMQQQQQQPMQPIMNQMMSQPPQQMTMQPSAQQQMQHQLTSQPLQPQPTPIMQQHPQPQAHQPPQLRLQSGQRVQYPSTVCVSSTNDFQTPRQSHPQTQPLGVGHMKSKSMSTAATGSRRVSTNQPSQYPHQPPQQQPFQMMEPRE